MEGPSEKPDETPKISHADYINRLEVLDAHADRQRSKGPEVMTEEFYGQLEGWEPESHRFVHDIVTSRIGLRIFTRAALEKGLTSHEPFLNSPEAVECYEMWINCMSRTEKIIINTTDRALAREIHDAFYDRLMYTENLQETVNWLACVSKYSTMKCPQDSTVPLIDFMPKSARKKAQEIK